MSETDITIPREAEEAVAKTIACQRYRKTWGLLTDLEREVCVNDARAACLAMLRAWPGMKMTPSWELRTHKRSVEIVLPLSEPPKLDRKAAVAERLFGDD